MSSLITEEDLSLDTNERFELAITRLSILINELRDRGEPHQGQVHQRNLLIRAQDERRERNELSTMRQHLRQRLDSLREQSNNDIILEPVEVYDPVVIVEPPVTDNNILPPQVEEMEQPVFAELQPMEDAVPDNNQEINVQPNRALFQDANAEIDDMVSFDVIVSDTDSDSTPNDLLQTPPEPASDTNLRAALRFRTMTIDLERERNYQLRFKLGVVTRQRDILRQRNDRFKQMNQALRTDRTRLYEQVERLENRTRILTRENFNLRNADANEIAEHDVNNQPPELECNICLTRFTINSFSISTQCGHMACSVCVSNLRTRDCHICRRQVYHWIKIITN